MGVYAKHVPVLTGGALERFKAKLGAPDPATGCIEWQAGRHERGYGTFRTNNVMYKSHRIAYVLAHGSIPSGLVIDHLCRNTACCNPEHLEAVPQRENIARGTSPEALRQAWVRRTHCKNGHEFSDANTRIHKGRRDCRTCSNTRAREAHRRAAERKRLGG